MKYCILKDNWMIPSYANVISLAQSKNKYLLRVQYKLHANPPRLLEFEGFKQKWLSIYPN